MKLYSIECTLNATGYVKANSEEEAQAKFKAWVHCRGFELEGEGICGLPYSHPALPEISLSPAMTSYALPGATADEVE